MPRLIYTALLYLLMPLVLARLIWRALRAPAYARRWPERFGLVGRIDDGKPIIWVHAVSVGETLASVPLIRALQQKYEQAAIMVTTTTPTGSAQVLSNFGHTVHHAYAPYDLPGVLARFFDRVNPDLVIVMETELWPNLIACCRRRRIPVAVANARLSAKSAGGYRKVGRLVRPMLRDIALVAAQDEEDGRRFVALGLASEKLQVTGNIKFDLELDAAHRTCAARLRARWRGGSQRPIWLAASTHNGEEDQVLAAFDQVLTQIPDLLLVLVPRHPERFGEVERLCLNRGYRVQRHSAGNAVASQTQVLIGDTMGELLNFYGACDLAFVGGSLVPTGGHNLIEPAAWGVAVLSGPHLFNFVGVAAKLLDANALVVCADSTQLAAAVLVFFDDADARLKAAAAAQAVADLNRGALPRLTASLSNLLC